MVIGNSQFLLNYVIVRPFVNAILNSLVCLNLCLTIYQPSWVIKCKFTPVK